MQSCQERDLNVVRLHTGEPSLFGAIAEQMRGLKNLSGLALRHLITDRKLTCYLIHTSLFFYFYPLRS